MINIEDIIPFMKKGWVAMDKDGEWNWFSEEPVSTFITDCYYSAPFICSDCICLSGAFDIAPADDWEKSLIKVG